MKTEPHVPHAQHEDACCGSENETKTKDIHDDHDHDHDHDHSENEGLLMTRWPLWVSLVMLFGFLSAQYIMKVDVARPIEIGLMLSAYVLAGYKTVLNAFRKVSRGDFFNEFTLMTIATFGAFYIGEFSEGVAVMIFYEIGELFQDFAVSKSKRSIKALLDIRPDSVTVIRNLQNFVVSPSEVQIGEKILVKPGEKVALDGTLASASGTFNTAALTGESRPDMKSQHETVLAGMINTEKAVEINVGALFKDSKLSRILEMVQEASARKAPTQLLISRLAKIYTPVVFLLALLIILVPYFLVPGYDFQQWLYRGMVFLVIACPCALTISIPLGYFGGIGLASRNGILVKGANFLDVMTRIDTFVSDKTGTLTKGVFKVQRAETDLEENTFLATVKSLESFSTHPVARAIASYKNEIAFPTPVGVEEISGHGLKGIVDGKEVLAGNLKLLSKFSVTYPAQLDNIAETLVAVAINNRYVGHITISDEVKEDAAATIAALKSLGIDTVMLSGDQEAVTAQVAKDLQITRSYGGLLPEGKVAVVKELKAQGKHIAFAGDGVNDAPVIALSDVGIAMGGLGSDAAIETADIVIQNDQPMKIVAAIKIGKLTRSVVFQNISLAMGVKIIVMILGAGGVATLWEAVFADVGVAVLAILNAFRIQSKTIA
jgi:Cd2+/Zn2+-exporting ATPase